MKRVTAILLVGIVIAIMLPAAITAEGNAVQQEMYARTTVTNHIAPTRTNQLFVLYPRLNSTQTPEFNLSATATYPSTVQDQTLFNMTISFTILLPPNASYYHEDTMFIYLLSVRNPATIVGDDYEFIGLNYSLQVDGIPNGGSGVGYWNNITIEDYPNAGPAMNPQSWLSFTNQLDAYLWIEMHGSGDMVTPNGTKIGYSLTDLYTFQATTITIYTFTYPIGAWLGYGTSILTGIISLILLIRTRLGPVTLPWEEKPKNRNTTPKPTKSQQDTKPGSVNLQ